MKLVSPLLIADISQSCPIFFISILKEYRHGWFITIRCLQAIGHNKGSNSLGVLNCSNRLTFWWVGFSRIHFDCRCLNDEMSCFAWFVWEDGICGWINTSSIDLDSDFLISSELIKFISYLSVQNKTAKKLLTKYSKIVFK